MHELIQDWRDHSVAKKDENRLFLKSLGKAPKKEMQEALTEAHDEAFRKIDCLGCANCCKTTPAMLLMSDIRRLAVHLNISSKQFIRRYVLEDITGEMTLNGVPCTFLNPDNTCSVYEIRPEACRRYPHTNEKGYEFRTELNLSNTIVCPAAYYVIEKIKLKIPAL